MTTAVTSQSNAAHKLGLSLSGGGFRATIFHIGVLKRLAEMDLLRHVAAISTVSGGSVTGAHYLLHLKLEMEKGKPLTQQDYERIVSNMEAEFRRGVARNPRSRLFLNFFRNLKIFCFSEPPGERMASIYQYCIFDDVTGQLKSPEAIRLHDMWINLEEKIKDLSEHNRKQAVESRTSQQVPKLILNASCLNSGREFLFTAAEVGDPQLGFIRMDEAHLVADCKSMLADAQNSGFDGALKTFAGLPAHKDDAGRNVVKRQAPALQWFLLMEEVLRERKPGAEPHPITHEGVPNFPAFLVAVNKKPELAKKLFEAEMRCLRFAKIAAWYLLDEAGWSNANRRGGYTREEHWRRFCRAIEDVDKVLAKEIGAEKDNSPSPALLEFVLCLYYLRSARAFAWDVVGGLEKLRLVDAVAASANFPPVFTPYHIHDLYDSKRIKVLALTDGGVHDNLGIRSLMDDECTDLIVSDAGGLYQESKSPPGDRIRMMARIGSVLTAHVRNLELDKLHDVADASAEFRRHDVAVPAELGFNLSSTAFFHMLSNPTDAGVKDGVAPHPHARAIAHIRTDLDVFGTVEIDALIYQGYQLADRFVREYLSKDLLNPGETRPPRMTPQSGPMVGKILSAASKRLGRWQAIYPVATAAIGIGAVVILIMWMLANNLSIVDVLRIAVHAPVALATALAPALMQLADRLGGWYWSRLHSLFTVDTPRSVLNLFLVVLAVSLVCSDRLERLIARVFVRKLHGNARWQVRRLKVARFLGPWRRNLTWLLWLLPIWIALLGTILCSLLMLGGLVTRYVTSRVPSHERNPLAEPEIASQELNP